VDVEDVEEDVELRITLLFAILTFSKIVKFWRKNEKIEKKRKNKSEKIKIIWMCCIEMTPVFVGCGGFFLVIGSVSVSWHLMLSLSIV
jgi:hypothetical protein